MGATLEAAEVMLTAIKKFSSSAGFKVSGGVRTLPQAEMYIALAEKIMGNAWGTPQHFCFGASQLLDQLRK